MSTSSIKTAILEATLQLQQSSELTLSPAEARFEANLLLEHVLHVNRAWIIAHQEEQLTSAQQGAYTSLIDRRSQGQPVAYLMGEREFFGLRLKVTPATLIPRPDTETLVETALAHIPKQASANEQISVLDLGTGTGAIALAIASQRRDIRVVAIDASMGALAVARENAQNLQLPHVEVVHSHWFEALADQTFDVIVSNPPYIEEHDAHLQQGDLRFEPRSALASGPDGLDDIRHIVHAAPAHLRPHGWLLFEHGYHQASKVAALLAEAGFSNIQHALDLAGIQRVTFGQLKSF